MIPDQCEGEDDEQVHEDELQAALGPGNHGLENKELDGRIAQLRRVVTARGRKMGRSGWRCMVVMKRAGPR